MKGFITLTMNTANAGTGYTNKSTKRCIKVSCIDTFDEYIDHRTGTVIGTILYYGSAFTGANSMVALESFDQVSQLLEEAIPNEESDIDIYRRS